MPSSEWLIRVCEHGHRVEWHASYDGWLHMDAETATMCRAGTPSTVAVVAAKASPVIPAPTTMEFDRHTLRTAATKLLWDKRSMMPEHSDEIVDDVLTVVFAHYTREVIQAPKCRCQDELDGGMGSLAEAYRQRGETCPDCHGTGVAEALPEPDDEPQWLSMDSLPHHGGGVMSRRTEPVAEVIPVAVLRELRAWIAKSQALPALRSQDFEAGRQLAFKAVVGWLDEHTREEPRP